MPKGGHDINEDRESTTAIELGATLSERGESLTTASEAIVLPFEFKVDRAYWLVIHLPLFDWWSVKCKKLIAEHRAISGPYCLPIPVFGTKC